MEDYKEKLRLAKEALDSDSYDKETIEYIFPELKESEDERIRKSLIKSYTNQHPCNFPTVDGFTREQILAWLKKQGEQKLVEWSAYDKATLEYIIEDIKELCDNETEEGSIETYNREINLLQAINESIKLSSYTNPVAWSEEDEQMFTLCALSVKTRYNDGLLTCNEYEQASLWLKSLKEKYTWKPSDEQMKALWDSIPENVKEISEREMLLDSLYQDLKKLREK